MPIYLIRSAREPLLGKIRRVPLLPPTPAAPALVGNLSATDSTLTGPLLHEFSGSVVDRALRLTRTRLAPPVHPSRILPTLASCGPRPEPQRPVPVTPSPPAWKSFPHPRPVPTSAPPVPQDLAEFYKDKLEKEVADKVVGTMIGDVMSTRLFTVEPSCPIDKVGRHPAPVATGARTAPRPCRGKALTATLDPPPPPPQIDFGPVSGMPVMMGGNMVGIVSKKDVTKPGKTVEDIMTKRVVVTKSGVTVEQAAVVMLKYKVHRLPVVDDSAKLIGIVTRTDIFSAMEHDLGMA